MFLIIPSLRKTGTELEKFNQTILKFEPAPKSLVCYKTTKCLRHQ